MTGVREGGLGLLLRCRRTMWRTGATRAWQRTRHEHTPVRAHAPWSWNTCARARVCVCVCVARARGRGAVVVRRKTRAGAHVRETNTHNRILGPLSEFSCRWPFGGLILGQLVK